MNLNKIFTKAGAIIILTFALLFLSCDVFKDTTNYKINIFFICSGTGGELFNVTIISDGKTPITASNLLSQTLYPAGKITTATITATRQKSADSLMILVYKDNKLDDKGFAILPTCTSSSTTTYCSDTLTLAYKVTDDNETKAVSGSSTTSSSSSSSSSSTTE
jgi:hypothetical protein